MDYEEMSEPNMKLSRALLIVLVLHVVAVAGIIAFNTIKSRQGAFPPPSHDNDFREGDRHAPSASAKPRRRSRSVAGGKALRRKTSEPTHSAKRCR